MNNKLLCICLFFLLSSCATKEFLRYEKDELLSKRLNLSRTEKSVQYDISVDKITKDSLPHISVTITEKYPIEEKWEDIYSKVGVYATRCRGWREYKPNEENKYCDFNTKNFLTQHLFLIGFLMDLAIPFQPYNEETIETKESAEGTITEKRSDVVYEYFPIKTTFIKLNIGSAFASSKLSENGIAHFDFKSLKLDMNDLPYYATASLEIQNKQIDITKEINELLDTERAEQRKPENKYKMEFCKANNLFNTLYNPFGPKIESDCIYILRVPLRVLQSISNGILVTLAQPIRDLPAKTFFIKTKKQYADQDIVGEMHVKSIGTIKYTTVLGVVKTINAFQQLDD